MLISRKSFVVWLKIFVVICLNIVVNYNSFFINVFFISFVFLVYVFKLRIRPDVLENIYLILFFLWGVMEICLNL